jgi:hypothetical protein
VNWPNEVTSEPCVKLKRLMKLARYPKRKSRSEFVNYDASGSSGNPATTVEIANPSRENDVMIEIIPAHGKAASR